MFSVTTTLYTYVLHTFFKLNLVYDRWMDGIGGCGCYSYSYSFYEINVTCSFF